MSETGSASTLVTFPARTLATIRDTLLKEDTREGYSDGVLDMYNEALKLKTER